MIIRHGLYILSKDFNLLFVVNCHLASDLSMLSPELLREMLATAHLEVRERY